MSISLGSEDLEVRQPWFQDRLAPRIALDLQVYDLIGGARSDAGEV